MSGNKNIPTDMAGLRQAIDRVDTALLNLIAERMELARGVREAKSGMNVWRPAREESHVRDLAKKARGTDPSLISHIWAELTSASLSLQGPIRLHIALMSDALSQWSLVRDRFGASIPSLTYPTASAALAAAFADEEGVAVLPAPGGMNNWWTALAPGAAASGMNILAPLPRIGDWDWPAAVAVSRAMCEPSGEDISLIYVEGDTPPPPLTLERLFSQNGLAATLRAQMGKRRLYSVSGYVEETDARLSALRAQMDVVARIGILPCPIARRDAGDV
ncbi:MAG TPA: hypothetical protein ENK01_04580 [Hellea balneolensis]|uniref:chorismate mutase n=1 Tax=Hellea balneolensis TaxID=287478 RepID=A0A7V5NXV7_9PROT|nr:hypothetical protein [Hellea balneolensis]